MGAQPALARGFQYALLVFILTALIGLANATKIFGTLDQNTLLTHLHSGTLGWITLGALTVAAWLFGASGPTLARNLAVTAVATVAYVLAFWSGNFTARAVFGAGELVVILLWWSWVASRSAATGFAKIGNAKLSILLGLTTLVIGSTIGVIIQAQFALGLASPQTGDLIGAHASAQVAGYLILVATGIIEWILVGDRRTAGGTIQATLLFLAGLSFALGELAGVQPLLLATNVLQIAATIVVAVRLGRVALAAIVGTESAPRHAAAVILYLFIGVVLIIALVQQFLSAAGDPSKVSQGLLHSLDHTFFVGVTTNALFGAILMFTAGRRRVWAWADAVIFWGLNVGVLSFTAVLLVFGSSTGAQPFAHPVSFTAPIMGLSALLGIATYLARLQPAAPAVRAASPA